jgi:transposase-like protein
MPSKPPYPPEVRERAIKMVFEYQAEYPSQWRAISSIAGKFGMTAEALRSWVRQAEIDRGKRPGITTSEAERIKDLERENRELRGANEILKAASAFFARELDRQPPKRWPGSSTSTARSSGSSRSARRCRSLRRPTTPSRSESASRRLALCAMQSCSLRSRACTQRATTGRMGRKVWLQLRREWT